MLDDVSRKYVLASVRNVEESFEKKRLWLSSKCYTPLPPDYQPELDTSNELKSDGIQCFQELIGILRWTVELGRVDILLETSLLSSHLHQKVRNGELTLTW